MLHSTMWCAVKKEHVQKVIVVEMRLLGWMSGDNVRDKLRNEFILQ